MTGFSKLPEKNNNRGVTEEAGEIQGKAILNKKLSPLICSPLTAEQMNTESRTLER